ncbi:HMG-Y-related protein A-like [Canna indica]|uniref:HMG-Y-related protein A-like n=1 Tax=Canna indica TaxID=4628 RepID=A0AAQ3KF17_9LILI|nr:HMG-Y-related protein A-like [Canna indica]
MDDTEGARKRLTPDHPPYALMIDAAIRHLAEEGGSTASAISAYIRAHYDGLPWAHDKLLPYYLHKLTAQGEFSVGASGRYSVRRPSESLLSAASNGGDRSPPVRARRRRLQIKRKRSKADAAAAPLRPEAGDDDGSCVSSMTPPPTMRFCRSKRTSVERLEYVLALPCQFNRANAVKRDEYIAKRQSGPVTPKSVYVTRTRF